MAYILRSIRRSSKIANINQKRTSKIARRINRSDTIHVFYKHDDKHWVVIQGVGKDAIEVKLFDVKSKALNFAKNVAVKKNYGLSINTKDGRRVLSSRIGNIGIINEK